MKTVCSNCMNRFYGLDDNGLDTDATIIRKRDAEYNKMKNNFFNSEVHRKMIILNPDIIFDLIIL